MLGPLSDPNVDHSKLKEFFPTYHRYKPIACAKKPKASDEIHTEENPNPDNQGNPSTDEPIILTYMNNVFRVFRSCPLFRDPSDYLGWLEKIEKKKSQVWKEVGIFDLIQLSKVGPCYCQTMLVSSLYFWDNTHHTFHFPCGMITPTLFDITAITGLKPTGETYDPDFMSKDTIGFDTYRVVFTTHISYYHDHDIDEVSDTEHITFLALWLSHCVFCSKSLQVAKKYFTLANQLHAGRNVCLSEMILANLY